MNKLICKLWLLLKSNIWLIAAFVVPLVIRSVPEFLSWPYPLGLDTLRYIQVIDSGAALANPLAFVHYQFFYPLATLMNWLIGNSVVVIKVLGPILMGSVAVMIYLYARKVLCWSSFKSFFVSLLLSIYFVSLRNSWDLYAQSLALIFLFATLIVLKSSNLHRRFLLAVIFMFLTVLAHQLVSVVLFIILGLEAIREVIVNRQLNVFVFTFVSLGLAGALFFFRPYSPSVAAVVNVASAASLNLALYMAGLLLYCFFLLLPFAAVGVLRLKDWVMRFWAAWCIGVVVVLMFAPDLPLYYWNRWVYLLVYPLLFFTVEGLDWLWNFWSKHKSSFKRCVLKVVAVLYVVLLLALSGFYLAAPPENQLSLFSTDNPYLTYISSSMLQNTLPISDNSYLVDCVAWIDENAPAGSVVVAHFAIYDLIRVYYPEVDVISVEQGSMWGYLQNETAMVDSMIEASRDALASGNSVVYTVWWTNGQGWYGIPSLTSDFKEVYSADGMAVYVFDAKA